MEESNLNREKIRASNFRSAVSGLPTFSFERLENCGLDAN